MEPWLIAVIIVVGYLVIVCCLGTPLALYFNSKHDYDTCERILVSSYGYVFALFWLPLLIIAIFGWPVILVACVSHYTMNKSESNSEGEMSV